MLRFPLGEALSGVPATFDAIQRFVPEIGIHARAFPLVPGGGRLIKTHEPYRREYKRAIYIVRDVRDVMLSSFARESAMDVLHIRTLDEYVRPFMEGRMTRFGSWQQHVDGWMNSPLAKRGDLLVLSFEEMRKDLEGSVARCLDFLGKRVDPSVVQNVVRNNSLENMRAKEDQAKRLPQSPKEEGRQVSRGSIQGWRQKLTQQQIELIDEFAGDLLARLHYPRGINDRLVELQHLEKITQRLEISAPWSDTAESVPDGSGIVLQPEKRSSDDYALRLRIAGRIANFFSWYRY